MNLLIVVNVSKERLGGQKQVKRFGDGHGFRTLYLGKEESSKAATEAGKMANLLNFHFRGSNIKFVQI